MQTPDSGHKSLADLQDLIFVLSPGYKLVRSNTTNNYLLKTPRIQYDISRIAGEFLARCTGDKNISEILSDLENRFTLLSPALDMVAFICEMENAGWITQNAT